MKHTLILVLALLWVSLVGVAILSEKLKPITKIVVEVMKEVAVDMKDMKVTVLSDSQYEMMLSSDYTWHFKQSAPHKLVITKVKKEI